jgi:hypothetical protein
MADEIIMKGWMEQLGVADGADLAARILGRIQQARSQETAAGVSADAILTIGELTTMYRDRGVSDSLVLAWRVACQQEINRVFGEYRRHQRQSEAA